MTFENWFNSSPYAGKVSVEELERMKATWNASHEDTRRTLNPSRQTEHDERIQEAVESAQSAVRQSIDLSFERIYNSKVVDYTDKLNPSRRDDPEQRLDDLFEWTADGQDAPEAEEE